MGLFGSKKEGGILDVIRCDESDYLVWKWSPSGQPSRKENAIRYGSSLRVKDGEVAIFVYHQKNGMMQDYIEGPYDQIIKTANFPVLTSIVGTAFGGNSPFQAEVYYINLAGAEKIPFFIKEFNVTDPRNVNFAVPVTVKGSITFGITDYRDFIRKHRLHTFDMNDLQEEVKDAVIRYTKSAITNAPFQNNIPVTMLENAIEAINGIVEEKLKVAFLDYGLTVKRVDLSEITLNQDCEAFRRLQYMTSDADMYVSEAQRKAVAQNQLDMQAIGAENMAESMRINREETQRRQRLQSESEFLSAHQINLQADVAKTAAASLGQMGGGMDFGGSGGMNPAGMMVGMMMGGAVGSNMANMMGNAMQGMNKPQPPQPPAGVMAQYHVSLSGQQSGPYTLEQIKQMVMSGHVQANTYVWKPGMSGWTMANHIPEVASLFGSVPPPMPPMPPTPPEN